MAHGAAPGLWLFEHLVQGGKRGPKSATSSSTGR
jgi:hypothetical protein